MGQAQTSGSPKLGAFSPGVFLPLFVLSFYLVGLTLVQFSLRALGIVALSIAVYLLASRLTARFIDTTDQQTSRRTVLSGNYFERLLISLCVIFVIDLALKGVAPVAVRAPLYLIILSAAFYFLGRKKTDIPGTYFLSAGVAMILLYVVPAFISYGMYGAYLNRTGGLMPAFLVGIGTITTVYGLMKVASLLSTRNLFIMIGLITLVAGPFMAAIIGYRAYAIIYIMPLIFQYYIERKPAVTVKTAFVALGVVAAIFLYTYFATSVTRGVIYMFAPLDSAKAPPFVVSSMEAGHYTDKDMNFSNAEARSKVITRPFFTYKVFLDVIDVSYPWGKSHGKLTLSLMPGVTKGRATTISILKKPLSTSFFGLPFLEFGVAGVMLYGLMLGVCLAVASRLRDKKTYALILTIIMLWLDTGPSVWWHWLPFASSFIALGAILLSYFVQPEVVVTEDRL
ncbi:MAG TPA: hypothetical protein VGK02_11665 [Candidatus Aquicultor sp.]|jgi:hypothetical protein